MTAFKASLGGTFALSAATLTSFKASLRGAFAERRAYKSSLRGTFQKGYNSYTASLGGYFSNAVDRDDADNTEIDYGTASPGEIAAFDAVMGSEMIPPDHWVSRRFRVVLRGNPDLVLPVASLTARKVASGRSYVELSIPDTGDLIDDIVARKTKKIIVSREYVYASGIVCRKLFIKLQYDSISTSQTPTGVSITLKGRRKIAALNTKRVVIDNIVSRDFSGGQVTYTSEINDRLMLGYKAVITLPGGTVKTHRIGEINYTIDTVNASMTFTEYDADGIDKPFAIGANAR